MASNFALANKVYCSCPVWERADDFDGPEDFNAAWEGNECLLHA